MADRQPIIDRIIKIMGDYKLERKVVWWIVDLFRIPLMVNDYNQSVSVEVAKDAKNLA